MPDPVLGRPAEIPATPEAAVLDRVPNPHPDVDYLIRFAVPEFTALCPITGQPDFAHLVIDYVADQWLVESKSLKLYMHSFRNHGSFHEATTLMIGGIPIDVFWQTATPPSGLWLPEQGVAAYRGRG